MEISKQPLQQGNCSSKSPEQQGWHDTEDLNYWYQGAWKEIHLQPDKSARAAQTAPAVVACVHIQASASRYTSEVINTIRKLYTFVKILPKEK